MGYLHMRPYLLVVGKNGRGSAPREPMPSARLQAKSHPESGDSAISFKYGAL